MSVATQPPVAAPIAARLTADKPNILLALLQAPSVIALFLWMIVPLLMTIYFSFIRFSLLNPDISGFAGIENYQFLTEDESFWPAIINTVILMGAVLIITTVLGTLLAVLYDRQFFGKNVATLLVIAPFFIMPTVSALIWKNLIMHPVYGLLAFVLQKFGLHAIDWFGEYPLVSVIIIIAWEWLPFAFLILYTSLKSLDSEQKEAAAIDGASPIQLFFYIIVPHLKRATGVVVMIETIFLLSIFAEIYTTTSGGPGHATTNLAYLVYSLCLHQFIFGIIGWVVAVIIFFPIFWMAITAFKTEQGAYSPDLIFVPTLDSFKEVFSRSNYLGFMMNSIYISLGSTLVCFLFAIPAAYKMSFFPTPKTQSTLLWMLSTKMMPAVGVLVPIYFLFRTFGLLDTVVGLIIIYTLMNLPIAVWMSYTYFCEIPAAILEAGRIDGATLWQEIWHLLRPMTLPGLSSTGLILIIFAWNEAFWSINLTSANAAPLTAFIASYSSPEGLFWAKLSAASLLAVAPIMVLGWLTQKQLVQGLTFGAVK